MIRKYLMLKKLYCLFVTSTCENCLKNQMVRTVMIKKEWVGLCLNCYADEYWKRDDKCGC